MILDFDVVIELETVWMRGSLGQWVNDMYVGRWCIVLCKRRWVKHIVVCEFLIEMVGQVGVHSLVIVSENE